MATITVSNFSNTATVTELKPTTTLEDIKPSTLNIQNIAYGTCNGISLIHNCNGSRH